MAGAMSWAKQRQDVASGKRQRQPLAGTTFHDTGCPDGVHPSCLNCPLPVCRFDDQAYSPWRLEKASKLETVRRALEGGATVDGVSEMHGVSRRTVFRVMAARDGIYVGSQDIEGGRIMAVSIEDIGNATVRALRSTLERVTAAEGAVAEAQRALAEARSAAAGEVRQLGDVLRALNVSVPSDLSESMRLILRTALPAGNAMADPANRQCDQCPRTFGSYGARMIHAARKHKAA